ncbi:hypothetical protein K525DRAFT_273591 [Schizophyllum commune Loenen D]|nr:hypothetical protein K525DRAFT_273591 [Schizophyllum commune Loenen D]
MTDCNPPDGNDDARISAEASVQFQDFADRTTVFSISASVCFMVANIDAQARAHADIKAIVGQDEIPRE